MNREKEWILSTNLYEVNLRQYTHAGTFNAFKEHLPRLKEMGVETLWFMPLTPIAQKNKKGSLGSYYACSDYTAINPEFGTEGDWIALVAAAKKLGLRILIDWVANHTGWDHKWTISNPEWYLKDESGEFKKASGMDDIIELDFNNREMRREMIACMLHWLKKYDIDGFRCDLASWVRADFWKEAKQETDKIKPLFWLAEADALENPEYMEVFDAAYTWKWMHRTQAYYNGETNFAELLSILHQYRNAPGYPTWFTSNHDENSWNGTEYEKYGDMAEMLAVFGITFPGIPLMYSGQELPNHKRLAFFDKDHIEWNEHPSMQDFYGRLLRLKKQHPCLRADLGLERIHSSADEKCFCFIRKYNNDEILVCLNFSSQQIKFEIYDERVKGIFKDFLSGEAIDFSLKRTAYLPSYGYLIALK